MALWIILLGLLGSETALGWSHDLRPRFQGCFEESNGINIGLIPQATKRTTDILKEKFSLNSDSTIDIHVQYAKETLKKINYNFSHGIGVATYVSFKFDLASGSRSTLRSEIDGRVLLICHCFNPSGIFCQNPLVEESDPSYKERENSEMRELEARIPSLKNPIEIFTAQKKKYKKSKLLETSLLERRLAPRSFIELRARSLLGQTY